MSTHAITGRTRIVIAGEPRTLACDMNCAAALFEAKGENWSEWLVNRFLGEKVEGGRKVTPLTPTDTITALYALLSTDREDSGRTDETEKSLRRAIGLNGLPDLQLALVRTVLAGFGVPGEGIEAVVNAVDAPRRKAAAGGTGTAS